MSNSIWSNLSLWLTIETQLSRATSQFVRRSVVSKIRRIIAGLPFPLSGGFECVSRSLYGWFSCYRDAVPKQCCGLGSPPVRWSILGVGIVGLVCAGAGVLLGALRATGRDHFAVALLMIGKWFIDFPFSLLPPYHWTRHHTRD